LTADWSFPHPVKIFNSHFSYKVLLRNKLTVLKKERISTAFFLSLFIFFWVGHSQATAQLSISPTTLDFGSYAIGKSSTGIVTVSNPGSTALYINSISIDGDVVQFRQTNNCYGNLFPSQNCSIDVIFQPTAAGDFSALITIQTNVITEYVTVTGSSAPPGLSSLALYPQSLNFGNVAVGDSSTQTITVSNLGSTSLRISSISLSGDLEHFSQTNNCNQILPPNSNCKITARFSPTSEGRKDAEINLDSSDPAAPSMSASLTGVGVRGDAFNAFCLISTSLYGSGMEEAIGILRIFRDQFLLTNFVGKRVAEFYYRLSPKAAEFVTQHETLKPLVCLGILPIIGISWMALSFGPALITVFLLAIPFLSISVILGCRRRPRHPTFLKK
jgi:archaellum component FlaF (FlaF/FlaG flagellin family)